MRIPGWPAAAAIHPAVAALRTAALALVATAAMAAFLSPTVAAARYPCSYGPPTNADPTVDPPPEGRPYMAGFETLEPSARKYFARTTVNANGSTGYCECTHSRPWSEGMVLEATDSVKAAMDDKEAEAFVNYAKFGVSATAVPLEARTIWLRTAWRSREEQTCLYTRYGPDWAARPGYSIHESGYAIDIEDWGAQFFGQDARLLVAHGWCRTVPGEPWHYEYRPTLEVMGRAARCK